MNTPLNKDYLRECVDYDPETGVFTWKRRPESHFATLRACNAWNSRAVGKPAFCQIGPKGYRTGRFGGKTYLSHRLAWLWMKGEWPEAIDHINGNNTDNRFCNLRNVTTAENNRNVALRSDNTSGHAGIDWVARVRRWRARASEGGRSLHLGYFDTISEALAARAPALAALGYHENHGRSE